MNPYTALFTAIALGAGGQLALKQGATQAGTPINLFILLGLGAYFLSALFYTYSLRTIPLSVAFPSVSASYIVVAIAAHLLWREPFGASKIVSLLLICVGILLLHR